MKVTRRHIASAAAAAAFAVIPAAASAKSIYSEAPATKLPTWSGAKWTSNPITTATVPQNPFMTTNGKSNLHNDTWMTDSYLASGPLGKAPVSTSGNLGKAYPGVCASMAFDARGRIITICPILGVPTLRIVHPTTFAVVAEYELPKKVGAQVGNRYQDFTGGGYFYINSLDQIVIPTNDRRILVLGENIAGNGFEQIASYDISSVVASGEGISSALPDWQGNIWFVTKTKGKVGYVNPTTLAVTSITLNEEIENSFAIGSDGVYIASDKAMYRFNAAAGSVHRDWRTVYPNTGKRKLGQVDAGTGTTPTIMAGGLVAITDNADPMDVVVYNTTTGAETCKVPVFKKGASATENSLIGAGGALYVENNYGYESPTSVVGGKVTAPGVTRINVSPNGKTCTVAWKNTEERAASVVPKLSLGNGLIYLYTKPAAASSTDRSTPWFWTALDARTGRRAWRKLAGTGALTFNNNYAGIHLGPNGSLYIGTIGGIVRLADSP